MRASERADAGKIDTGELGAPLVDVGPLGQPHDVGTILDAIKELSIIEAADLSKKIEEEFGIQAAARIFFDKPAARLSLREAALLIAEPTRFARAASLGLVMGAHGAGTLLGMLLAPKAGKQMRKDLRRKFDSARETAAERPRALKERQTFAKLLLIMYVGT